jgi:esterase/lipase
MLKQLKLFQDPNILYPIYDLKLDFKDYISQCTSLIAQHRLDLNPTNAEKIIDANAPFELQPQQPSKYGALLIHGLLDSPFLMREMGSHLKDQNILVRSVLLPGHGTVPGALLHVDYRQWLQTVRYGIASFGKEIEKIYLVGYSTGASVALLHTLQEENPKIAGIISLAPALKICSGLAGFTHLHRTLSWVWPRAAWFHQDKNEMADYSKYLSLPFNAIYQVYSLAQAIKAAKPSTLPLLFILSQDDNTVCTQSSLRYFQYQPHPKNRLLLYSNTNSTFIDPRITIRHAAYPKQRIRNFSHLALPISPENIHYGVDGDYDNACHVTKDLQTIYGEFNPLQIACNNGLYKLKLCKYLYQRLTFNPDFPFLLQTIDKFIQDTAAD